jgi:site-specific DNA recombinase
MRYMENVQAPHKYCLYARKSSESDERQALSIDSQIKEMQAVASGMGIKVGVVKQESHSAKNSSERPVFNEMIREVRAGKYQGIVTWAPDRLSRNAGDLGSLVDLMDQGLLQEIRTPGQTFSNSPNDKFLLMILCSQAKLENDNKGVNVLRGMKTKCEMGWRPCMAPLGYLNDKFADKGTKRVFIDPQRGPVIKQMFEKVAYEAVTGRQLMRWLRDEVGLKSRAGKTITLSTIYVVLGNRFYTGEFEYPVGSGKFYQGEHEPLISKELFDSTRLRMAVNEKLPHGTKEFAFRGTLKCGGCGYGITASEKFKKIKGGSIRRYVYYHCTKKGADPCPEPSIREDILIEELLRIAETAPLNRSIVGAKLEQELQRLSMFSQSVLENDQTTLKKEYDLRNYVKFIIRSGTTEERKNAIDMLGAQLILKGQKLDIINL